MLDAETKHKIDNARDILVGKVPDPKSQVDQITIALIYKFMDDMDQKAEELGGKTKFFTGEFEKYAWSKLMDSKLGGRERLDLYGEGIQKMNQNKNIPQLFRDIFKDAFLPYRSPETLNLFLKEINNFTYDHSEQLGDAFEYLLSVMSSQGDAGMFRTPRHIIEFIVDVVDPDKDDKILDPACGTAGFLITAYKHILGKHTNKDKLTPDQRERLTRNLVGYDISPDMVRFSLVNMYLHKFPTPQIYEYDTLSSEERWGDRFDVIMANPPFMTPKGGIIPHKRFAISANRSELLFVDYIAEHLTPHGRAGIIVPEGIIFKSSNAYKDLRKMLVEDGYLWAVASLPAGVFNPYAGVKTSILFLDKDIAKSVKHILFVKIDSDGFDLGAQRRPVASDDLLIATEALVEYRKHVLSGGKLAKTGWPSIAAVDTNPLCQFVSKKELAKNDDYNLSGNRYKEVVTHTNQKWPMVGLEEVCETVTPSGKLKKDDYQQGGKYPIIDQSQEEIAGWSDNIAVVTSAGEPVVVFGDHTCAVKYVEKPFIQGADGIKILRTSSRLLPKYLFYLLKVRPIGPDGYKRHFSKLKRRKIPLPPLEVQKQIVEELDGYQKIINGAKQVVENWKPQIRINPDWEMVELGAVAKTFTDGNWIESKDQSASGFRLIQTGNIRIGEYLDKADKARFISEDTFKRLKCTEVFEGDILISRLPDPVGRACLVPNLETRTITAVDCTVVRFNAEKISPNFFIFYSASTEYFVTLDQFLTGSSRQRISRSNLAKVKIRLPPLETQKQIVAQIEAEKALVDSNKELITLYEQKIKDKVEEVWGK
ncbi:N-6 DNA methylase [Patescibacteria group bacterium]|nr:N-6 DNA methylase [Patescibacteria group bacterium]